MYNEWFSHMSKAIQKDIYFSLKVQMVQAKMNSYFFTCLQPHLYVKIHMPCTHINTRKWQWTTFWLAGGGSSHNEFFNYLHFNRIRNMKGCLLINKMQLQISNTLSAFLFVLWQVVYKYCDKSFINQPAF